MSHDIFLSYSRKDTALMERVCADLRAAGLTVWNDEKLQPGTPSWQIAIEGALQNARVMVVILSPDARASTWVGREIQYAAAQGLRIFPVLARGEERDAVPIALIDTQRVNLHADYQLGFQELVHALRGYLTGEERPPEKLPRPARPDAADEAAVLQPLSFFDHLRLFWWLFFDPRQLITNRIRPTEPNVQKTASWVISGIAWIPFLAPAVGLVIGTVNLPNSAPGVGLLISGLLGLGLWVIMARLGWQDNQNAATILMVVTAMGTLLFMLIGAGLDNIRFTAAGSLAALTFLLITSISIGIAAGIAFRLAHAATGGLAGMATGGVAYLVLSRTQLGVGGGIAGLAMVVVAFMVSSLLEQHFASGRRNWLSFVVGSIVVITYAALVWVYFLGGWQVIIP